jgi:cell division protein FtsI/penicillin-binding protein 2
VAGKTGTARVLDPSAGRLPFHNWFVGFVPAHMTWLPDSKLVVLAFAYDSNTVGNVATEMSSTSSSCTTPPRGQADWTFPEGQLYGGN